MQIVYNVYHIYNIHIINIYKVCVYDIIKATRTYGVNFNDKIKIKIIFIIII